MTARNECFAPLKTQRLEGLKGALAAIVVAGAFACCALVLISSRIYSLCLAGVHAAGVSGSGESFRWLSKR